MSRRVPTPRTPMRYMLFHERSDLGNGRREPFAFYVRMQDDTGDLDTLL